MVRTRNLVPIFSNFDFGLLDEIAHGGMPAIKSAVNMRVDISETPTNFVVLADLPGFNKENISVDFKDGVLTVEAEKTVEKESNEAEKIWRSERSYGQVKRSFQFGDDVDAQAIDAKYLDGVLSLTLPKKVKEESNTKVVIN